MNRLASPAQLRASLLRWVAVCVPLVVVLGFLSGQVGGNGGAWYAMLAKPPITPPGWVFPVAWTLFYAMQGVALALVLNARGAADRAAAVALFGVQLALNLAWSPIFFGWHQVGVALWVIAAMVAAAAGTAVLFGRVRPVAGWLMVPYLAWLVFAAMLNWSVDRLNPDAATLVPGSARTTLQP